MSVKKKAHRLSKLFRVSSFSHKIMEIYTVVTINKCLKCVVRGSESEKKTTTTYLHHTICESGERKQKVLPMNSWLPMKNRWAKTKIKLLLCSCSMHIWWKITVYFSLGILKMTAVGSASESILVRTHRYQCTFLFIVFASASYRFTLVAVAISCVVVVVIVIIPMIARKFNWNSLSSIHRRNANRTKFHN